MRWIVSAAAATALAGVAYSSPLAGNAPVAVDDFAFLDGSVGGLVLSPLDNDTDDDGDALSIVGISGPASEFARVEGNTIVFAAPDGFYAFNYTIEDSEGLQSTASMLVFVFSLSCGLVECG